MRAGFSVAMALLALGAAACGGGSAGGRFENDEFGITFDIPSDFDKVSSVSLAKTAGSNAAANDAVALDENNGIFVSRYDLTAPITSQNLEAVKPDLDRLVGQIAEEEVSGRRVDYGAMPGYEYEIPVSKPPQGRSRIAFLFDGDTEYELNCQSTPPKRDQVEEACRQALDTVKRTSG